MNVKGKIFEPVLKKIVDKYREEKKIYEEILDLAERQREIKSQKEISFYTEMTMEKTKYYERIENLNDELKRDKNEVIEALRIEEFTISALKQEFELKIIDELLLLLSEIAEVIKKIQLAEDNNEENFKRILKIV